MSVNPNSGPYGVPEPIGLVATWGSSGGTGATSAAAGHFPGGSGSGSGQGSNARTTNEPGGTAGTVSAVSGSSLVIGAD
jgi:hypothetical protein